MTYQPIYDIINTVLWLLYKSVFISSYLPFKDYLNWKYDIIYLNNKTDKG